MKKFIYLAFLGTITLACQQRESANNEKEVVVLEERENYSEQSLACTYSGTIHCADCQGIAMTLTLRPDNIYTLQENYQGGQKGQSETEGTWSIREKGKQVQLLQAEAEESHKFDVLDQNRLRLYQLVTEREEVGHDYELKRVNTAPGQALQ